MKTSHPTPSSGSPSQRFDDGKTEKENSRAHEGVRQQTEIRDARASASRFSERSVGLHASVQVQEVREVPLWSPESGKAQADKVLDRDREYWKAKHGAVATQAMYHFLESLVGMWEDRALPQDEREYRDGSLDRQMRNARDWLQSIEAEWARALFSAAAASEKEEEVALWQYRWTNPLNDKGDWTQEKSRRWETVAPRDPIQTLEQRLEELRSYSYDGKPCYEVRALYAASAVSPSQAQSDWPSISEDEETVRAAIQAAQLVPNKDMEAYEALARLVTRAVDAAAGIQSGGEVKP